MPPTKKLKTVAEVAAEAAAMTAAPRAPIATVDPVAEFADFPADALEVLEQRLLDPDEPGTLPIRLKDEPAGTPKKWHLRWFNTAVPGRYQKAYQLGYRPVEWEHLTTRDDIADRFEGSVRNVARGEKGTEVLMRMPLVYFEQIKREQEARRNARDKAMGGVKGDLQERAAQDVAKVNDRLPARHRVSGDEAAAMVGGMIGGVREERATVGDELA